ncbi:MAG TPA: right-handed parallel beta-helix repeat-containing protein [Blastocatellia bacterium]|nr:right-handed parallel beta-helix repeat-containing protein [Blastocatellia bacterium]
MILLCAVADAKTIYVSPSGRDSNPGTLAAPVATPQRAIELSALGDTVYLRAGRYTVSRLVWIGVPNLTVSSYPGERAVIAAGTTEPGDPQSVVVIAANNVVLSNVEIEGASYYGVKVEPDSAKFVTGVVIRGCYIHHTGRDAIKTFNADKLLIEDCEIASTGVRADNAEGIDSIGSVGITIRRCYIHDTRTTGLYLKGGARDGLVEQCRIVNAAHSGLLLGQDTDVEFMRDGTQYEAINCVARNNVIVGSGGAGLGTCSGNNIRFENNTLVDVARNGQAGFLVAMNNRDVPSRQVTFKNNIVVVSGERPLAFVINLADQLVSDSNIWFRPGGGVYKFSRETRDKGDYWQRFADWQAGLNVDRRSRTIDPRLDAANLYRPLPGSPAIDRGEALADVTTDYAGAARPQGAAFDIGAFEAAAGTPGAANLSETTDAEEAPAADQQASHAGPLAFNTWRPIVAVAGAVAACVSLIGVLLVWAKRRRPESARPAAPRTPV